MMAARAYQQRTAEAQSAEQRRLVEQTYKQRLDEQ